MQNLIVPINRTGIGRPRIDLTGKRFGKRLVLGFSETQTNRNANWVVRCDCGNEFVTLQQTLKSGKGCMMCVHKGDRPYRRLRPYEATYNIFKGRSRHKVDITYEQFVEFTKQRECHYCGDEIYWQEFRGSIKNGTGSNLDRKDSSGPYSVDNVVVCCGRCNYGKNRWFNYDEWKQIGILIRSWRDINKKEKELETSDKKPLAGHELCG